MQLTCLLPQTIAAVPITVEGVDYLAIRSEDLAALFGPAKTTTAAPAQLKPGQLKRAIAAHKKAVAKPKAVGRGKGSRKDGVAALVLSALQSRPMTALEISDAIRSPLGPTKCCLFRLEKKHLIRKDGGKWYPAKVAKAEPELPKAGGRTFPSIDPNAIEPLFLAALKTGPKSSEELIGVARKHGHTISSRFAVSTILEDHPDVIGGNGGRWTLAKGVPENA